MRPRGDDRGRQPGQHRGAARDLAGARLLGEIVRAHDEAGEPRIDVPGRAGDRFRAQDRERRFDHGPDPGAVRGAEAAKPMPTEVSVSAAETLGTSIASGAGLRRRDEVAFAPGRIRRIDADDEFAVP